METNVLREMQEVATDASLVEAPFLEGPIKNRLIASVCFAIVAVLSATLLAGALSSPETYSHTIQSLDGKKDTALTLTAVSATASAALSAIPDDACTPLADKLADISGDFLVVLTVIYLEKYMLTTFGLITCAFLIPLSCALMIAALVMRGRIRLRRSLMSLAAKLTLLGIVFVVTVPASTFISDQIEATYKQSIDETIAAAEIITEAAEETQEETQRDEATNPVEFLQQRIEDLTNAAEGAANMLGDALAWIQQKTGQLMEAAAITFVLSCIIPIITLLLLLWVAKIILGINVNPAVTMLKPGGLGRIMKRS